MNMFENEINRINYDQAVAGLRNRKDLTIDKTVEALDVYCSCLLQALLLHDEDSLQQQSNGSGWFIYRHSLNETENETQVGLVIRSVDKFPKQEIDINCNNYHYQDMEQSGHSLLFRTNELIPGVFHQNFPIISIPMSEIAPGIEPDGEWVMHHEDGITSFKQYPWQARDNLGEIIVQTSPGYFTQTRRRNSERSRNYLGYDLFSRGMFDENKKAIPVWQPHLVGNFFTELKRYARILRPVIFGTNS